MKTNEVIQYYGVTRKALLVYEKKGLIEPQRDSSGYRDYSQQDLKILTKIMLLRRLDLSLNDIENILKGDHEWVKKLEKQYDMEIKKCEIKKSYLHYVKDVIDDNYDVNEAIHSLDESIEYEKQNKSQPFQINIWLNMVLMIFIMLIVLYLQDIYMIMTMFIVIISICFISFLNTKNNNINKIIPYIFFILGGCGIFCYFQAKEIVIFKLLLIFSWFLIFYALFEQPYFNRIFRNRKCVNTFIVGSIIFWIMIMLLKETHFIVVNQKIVFFIWTFQVICACYSHSLHKKESITLQRGE